MKGFFCKKENVIPLTLSIFLVACGGGGGGSSSTSEVTSCDLETSTINITGTINYERVPFSATEGSGLDYNNIQTMPVRGAVIQALQGSCVQSSSETSSTGTYTLAVNPNTDVKIRVQAKLYSDATAKYDFEVRDNTSSNGLYTLDGTSSDTGSADSIRNLTATTGWGGTSYTGSRASAPFAILDSVYESVMKVVNVDADVNMDDADIFWSINNKSASGEKSDGDIGTSHYSNDELYILGSENSDTDEFDGHVIIHEWGHYFEDNLSRSDSIGGNHGTGNILDMRVALGEGFGNALSGMVTDDPVYRDSSGATQSADFKVDVDENSHTNPGWFSEGSVQSILYDLYDANADTNDAVNLGFSGIYNAFTSTNYKTQSTMTSLFSIIDEIKTLNTGLTTEIDTLVTAQTSSSSLGVDAVADKYATGETHSAYNTSAFESGILPIYKTIADDGVATAVCSHEVQNYNGVETRAFLRLNVASAGNHLVQVAYSSGNLTSANTDPDFRIYLDGVIVNSASSTTAGQDSVTTTLQSDEYIIEVYEHSNVGNATGGSACFNVTVTAS